MTRADLIAKLVANVDQDREHIREFIRSSPVDDLMPLVTAMTTPTDDGVHGMVNALALHAFAGILIEVTPEG